MSRALVLSAGVLMLGMAFPHALLGWPAVQERLGATTADRDLIDGIAVGWQFGSVAMVALAAVVLVTVAELRSTRWAWRIPLSVGLAYFAFGTVALVYRSLDPRFLLFIAVGALLIVGSLGASRASRESKGERS